ncbi:uncharacterized protein KQ657_000119 [Scheffersomyces spartinae]|uniref:CTP-dependent diacylglycerol kinase 1 n=1 Tax=Scheffersomyces spartinae TaxID=45513 RepID=A0A9P7VEB7_9ASCO|nr:uncharacterized protein KQ657_000119 [Scheffersomyces spartinae]KAG7196107.1 hypothetical protein KQ657_000119 [Scheffersomyces spartinae]
MSTSVPSTPRVLKISRTPKTTGKIITKRYMRTPDGKRTMLEFNDRDYDESQDATYIYEESEDEDDLYLDDEDDLIIEEKEIDSSEVESRDETESATSTTTLKVSDEIVNDFHNYIAGMGQFRQFLFKHEIPRKVFHSSIGFVTLYLYTIGVQHQQLIPVFIGLFAVLFVNDYARMHNPEFNRKMVKFFTLIARESEANEYNGTLWYVAGLFIVFMLYPKDICVMSCLLLSWADTSASTFGRMFGKYTPKVSKNKSLAGCMASFITGIASCYVFYGYFVPHYNEKVNGPNDIFWTPENSKLTIHIYSLLSGLVASFSEGIDIYKIDDNFTIPVLSGFFLNLVVKLAHK